MLKNLNSAIYMNDELKAMDAHKAEFHLTGSYAYKSFTDYSDYDFFAQDTPEIREWIEAQGFGIHVTSEYKMDERNVDTVYRKDCGVQLITFEDYGAKKVRLQVDIALVKSLSQKIFMQKILEAQHKDTHFAIASLPKEYRYAVYDFCWRVLDELMD